MWTLLYCPCTPRQRNSFWLEAKIVNIKLQWHVNCENPMDCDDLCAYGLSCLIHVSKNRNLLCRVMGRCNTSGKYNTSAFSPCQSGSNVSPSSLSLERYMDVFASLHRVHLILTQVYIIKNIRLKIFTVFKCLYLILFCTGKTAGWQGDWLIIIPGPTCCWAGEENSYCW